MDESSLRHHTSTIKEGCMNFWGKTENKHAHLRSALNRSSFSQLRTGVVQISQKWRKEQYGVGDRYFSTLRTKENKCKNWKKCDTHPFEILLAITMPNYKQICGMLSLDTQNACFQRPCFGEIRSEETGQKHVLLMFKPI